MSFIPSLVHVTPGVSRGQLHQNPAAALDILSLSDHNQTNSFPSSTITRIDHLVLDHTGLENMYTFQSRNVHCGFIMRNQDF